MSEKHGMDSLPCNVSHEWIVTMRNAEGIHKADRCSCITHYAINITRSIILSIAVSWLSVAHASLEVKRPDSPGLEDGLVGYWPFNGADVSGTIAYDRSGQSNNGTIAGSPLMVVGKLGQALNLDGVNDTVTAADHASLDCASAVTVSAWFYPRSLSGGWHVIAAKGIGNNSNYGLWHDGAKFSVTFSNGASWINHYTNQTYSPGRWYHLVGILDSVNDNARLYVNGQLDIDNQTETTNTPTNNDPFAIAADYGGNWADGMIDEVRVYNRALSVDEVRRLYNIGKGLVTGSLQQDNLTGGLVGYWPFNGPDISGTTAYDRSGNGYNGTIEGATKLPGKIGQALNFNGDADVQLPASLPSLSDFTVSAWVRLNENAGAAPGQNNAILEMDDTQGDTRLMLRSNGSYFAISGVVGFNFDQPLINEWVMVTITHSGTAANSYRNGVLMDSWTTNAGSVDFANAMIGAEGTTYYFNGVIDEFRLYDRVLSVSEMQALYNQGSPSLHASQEDQLTSGLVGYWPFNGPDVSGSVAYDRSGQGNHGTINSGATQPFVQVQANSGTGTAVSATFDGSSTSGNLIVVGVIWNDPGITCNVTDDKSNSYASAVGPVDTESSLREQLFYAKNITGGGPAITVTANLSSSVYAEIYIAEYTGMDTSAPLDQVSSGTGPSSGLAVTGSKTTTYPDEVIVGYCTSGLCSEGLGFTPRSRYNANVFEDRYVSSVGSYNATGEASSEWVILMATFKSSSPLAPASLVPGKVGQALRFNGSNEYIDMYSGTGFPTGDGAQWTLAAWVKANSLDSGEHAIICYGDNTESHTPVITLAGPDAWRVSTWGEANDVDALSPLPQAGKWTHLAGTCDGSNLRLYVNGVLAAGPAAVTNSPVDDYVRIGSDVVAGRLWNGVIDEVRVYDRALSGAEVKRLYNLGR